MSMRDLPHLFCQFADDVRLEVGGKQTIVGVYSGGLNVAGKTPLLLPQLAVVSYLFIPKDMDPAEVTLEVGWQDGKTLNQIKLPSEQIENSLKAERQANEGRGIFVEAVTLIRPFEIPGPGRIVASVIIDGDRIKGNALKIDVHDAPPAFPGFMAAGRERGERAATKLPDGEPVVPKPE